MRHALDDITFRNIINESASIREAIQKMGLIPAGGNYATVHKRLALLNLDTSHMLGQAHNRGKYHGPKRPIEDYLSNQIPIQSHKLRMRLLTDGIFEHRCMTCKLTDWLGDPIPLELEHKDGNHGNNTIENLAMLCPNCHARTPTYRGKNIKKPT